MAASLEAPVERRHDEVPQPQSAPPVTAFHVRPDVHRSSVTVFDRRCASAPTRFTPRQGSRVLPWVPSHRTATGDVGFDSAFAGSYVPIRYCGIDIRGSAATNEVRRDLYLNHALQAIEPGVTSLVVCLTAMIDEIET